MRWPVLLITHTVTLRIDRHEGAQRHARPAAAIATRAVSARVWARAEDSMPLHLISFPTMPPEPRAGGLPPLFIEALTPIASQEEIRRPRRCQYFRQPTPRRACAGFKKKLSRADDASVRLRR